MNNRIFSNPMYLYLSIAEFKQLRTELKKQNYHLETHTYHKFTSKYPYFENIYIISKFPLNKNDSSCSLISKDVIRSGQQKGLMLIHLDWHEAEDNRGSLDLFVRSLGYKIAGLGVTPDWLGYPICVLVNNQTLNQRKKQFAQNKGA